MIKDVSLRKLLLDSHKFEAGTPNAGGIVLGTASIIWTKLALKTFKTRTWIRLWNQTLVRNWRFENFGTAKRKPVISFNIEGIHPYDIGTIIDKLGIAVRTGHHCAQPIMTFSIQEQYELFYNTKEEIDVMVEAVKRAALMLS
jgi:cysteine desulfurase/selenocysteine lyase